jgi:hypothetical protein
MESEPGRRKWDQIDEEQKKQVVPEYSTVKHVNAKATLYKSYQLSEKAHLKKNESRTYRYQNSSEPPQRISAKLADPLRSLSKANLDIETAIGSRKQSNSTA